MERESIVPALRRGSGVRPEEEGTERTTGSSAGLSEPERMHSSAAASRRSMVSPYVGRTSSTRPTDQHRFRRGIHSAVSGRSSRADSPAERRASGCGSRARSGPGCLRPPCTARIAGRARGNGLFNVRPGRRVAAHARVRPVDRSELADDVLLNRLGMRATEPTSDNPTGGQTPTRRSESSPATSIVTAPHRCPPFIRTSTQPPTHWPGEERSRPWVDIWCWPSPGSLDGPGAQVRRLPCSLRQTTRYRPRSRHLHSEPTLGKMRSRILALTFWDPVTWHGWEQL